MMIAKKGQRRTRRKGDQIREVNEMGRRGRRQSFFKGGTWGRGPLAGGQSRRVFVRV